MQGQSLSTVDKERKLAAVCSMQRHILVSKPTILGQNPYYHIDLNAGCGFNKQFQVIGSPLVFLTIMHDIRYRAWFIDRDPVATEELKSRLQPYRGIEICTKDNRSALVEIAAGLPRNAVGSILADPNTWAYRNGDGEGIPVDELRQVCRSFRRMDLIMNLNVRVYSMMDGLNRKGPIYSLIHLDDFPLVFDRQHWLISHDRNGHSGFVRLVGRNFRTGDYAKWGWHHWDSPLGLKIREDIRTRKRDRDYGQSALAFEGTT